MTRLLRRLATPAALSAALMVDSGLHSAGPRRSAPDAGASVQTERTNAATPQTRRITEDQAITFALYGHLPAVSPLLGPNDVRISDMGPDGDVTFGAFQPGVAYNSALNEYLVVWWGDGDTTPLTDEEFEIYGQRISAQTGLPLGTNDFRISDMGPDGSRSFIAVNPAVVYNPTLNEYFVVWSGNEVPGEMEIYGQRISASGQQIGANDFRISNMGPDGSTAFGAFGPDVAHNPRLNTYLVVWFGDDDTFPLVDGEREIFGQHVDAPTGRPLGANDFRISEMGPNGDPDFEATSPAVAYNVAADEYLVVWFGDDSDGSLVDDEREIFAQRLAGSSLVPVGANDFRLSEMGPEGNRNFGAFFPDVTYCPLTNEYFVVWNGGSAFEGAIEIFGQRVTAAGAEVGPNDFQISALGPDPFGAGAPKVAFNNASKGFLVVWRDQIGNEREIFGQHLSAAGVETGPNDFRITHMGPDGLSGFFAEQPAIAAGAALGQFFVVWNGSDNTPPLVAGESEVFGQRIAPPSPGPGIPPTPTGLVATVIGTSAALDWNASPGATSYRLFATGPGIVFNQNIGNTTSIEGSGLPPGNYAIQLFAVNDAGENPVPASTNFTIGMTVLPQTPTGLTPTVTGRDATVRWNAGVGATSYRVRATHNGALVFDANIGGVTMAAGFGLPPGHYVVQVFSVNAAGQSAIPALTQFDIF